MNKPRLIDYAYMDESGHRYFVFMCECGREFDCRRDRIESGVTKSCGCYRKKYQKKELYDRDFWRKYCGGCDCVLPIESFYKRSNPGKSVPSLSHKCKECIRKSAKRDRQTVDNFIDMDLNVESVAELRRIKKVEVRLKKRFVNSTLHEMIDRLIHIYPERELVQMLKYYQSLL